MQISDHVSCKKTVKGDIALSMLSTIPTWTQCPPSQDACSLAWTQCPPS
jgi:hypothetical protein